MYILNPELAQENEDYEDATAERRGNLIAGSRPHPHPPNPKPQIPNSKTPNPEPSSPNRNPPNAEPSESFAAIPKLRPKAQTRGLQRTSPAAATRGSCICFWMPASLDSAYAPKSRPRPRFSRAICTTGQFLNFILGCVFRGRGTVAALYPSRHHCIRPVCA